MQPSRSEPIKDVNEEETLIIRSWKKRNHIPEQTELE